MTEGCALVTGASSGIGAATAVALAGLGMDVVAVARHPERLLEPERAGEVASRIDPVAADMTLPDEVEAAFSHAESAHGRVRFVVHSVGSEYGVGWFREMTPEALLGAIAALVVSPALVLRRALRSLREGGGSIGLVSSGAAQRPTPGRALYSSGKIALDRLVQSVGVECEAEGGGTGVFGVYPGRVDTPAQRRLMGVARDAPPAFRLERFLSSDELVAPQAVGTAIAGLHDRPPGELNGRILRYRPEGWKTVG